MLIGIHARSKTFFIYDPQGEVGQKESIRNAIIVNIDKEAASSGLIVSSLSSGKEWTYVECIAQEQLDTYNCGILVLLAFFRIVSLISRNTPLLFIISRWYCSISKPVPQGNIPPLRRGPVDHWVKPHSLLLRLPPLHTNTTTTSTTGLKVSKRILGGLLSIVNFNYFKEFNT
jgi:hypothetical protein